MAEIEFRDAKLGDICNRQGDILGITPSGSHRLIASGVAVVSSIQAEAAKAFGWELNGEWPPDVEMVQVKREAQGG